MVEVNLQITLIFLNSTSCHLRYLLHLFPAVKISLFSVSFLKKKKKIVNRSFGKKMKEKSKEI